MSQTGPGRAPLKGITLIELMELFPAEDSAERWFANIFWPDGVHRPACRSANIQTRPTRKPQPYRCRQFESLRALLQCGYHGTYHKVSVQHLPRYLHEFTGRLNQRDLDTSEQLAGIARGRVGKRLTYTALRGAKQES